MLVCRLFSSCEWGLLSSCGVRASRCSGFSCWGMWALGFSSSVVGVLGLDCRGAWACGIFLDPGIEPVSSALAGRFLTTEPPGKPRMKFYLKVFFCNVRTPLTFYIFVLSPGLWLDSIILMFHLVYLGFFGICDHVIYIYLLPSSSYISCCIEHRFYFYFLAMPHGLWNLL